MTYHDMAASTGSPGAYRNGITEWSTPQWLVDQLAAEFGPFDLDPAATAENAKAPAYITVDGDGLAQGLARPGLVQPAVWQDVDAALARQGPP